jgi:hypothetical protein
MTARLLLALCALACAPTSAASAAPARVLVRVTTASAGTARMMPAPARGRIPAGDLALVRSHVISPARRQAIAAAAAVRRTAALRDALEPLMAANRRRLRALLPGVRALGGRVVATDGMFGSLTASVPSDRLTDLRRLRGVAAIDAVVPSEKLSSWDSPVVSVGAPAFWSAGLLGGGGSADVRSGNLAVVEDLILRSHPDFAGVDFEVATPDQKSLAANDRHGTMVASMAVGQGLGACPSAPGYVCDASEIRTDNKGVAPGLGHVLDGQSVDNDVAWSSGDGFAQFAWILGITQHGVASSRTLLGAPAPAQVATDSNGAVIVGDDYDSSDAQLDALSDQFGLLYVQAAGNDGSSLPTICRARNPICVGAIDSAWTGDTADDQVAPYSTRGPSAGGQKKPDLVAVGNALVANRGWQTDNHLFTSQSGTSFAAPQAGAAAGLLVGSGITDPVAIKALLINSARPGRANPSQAMGTQTSWQPDWGWGMLDLEAALAQRSNFTTGTIAQSDARFFTSTSAAAGDRVTLVWNRRASYCGTVQSFCADGDGQAKSPGLSNLDLVEHTAAGAGSCGSAVEAESASTVDDVEQVRSSGPHDVVYTVRARSVVGAAAEPFAIAGTRQVTPVASPIAVTLQRTAGSATIPVGQDVSFTVTTSNPSSTMWACDPDTELRVTGPATISAVSTATDPGSLVAPGQKLERIYTVKATGAGHVSVSATGSSQSYGERLSREAQDAFDVADSGAISPPPSSDGNDTQQGQPAPPEAPFPPGVKSNPTPPAHARRAASSIKITKAVVAQDRRTLAISGNVAPHARGKVTVTFRVTVAGRVKVYVKRVGVRSGRFKTTLRVSSIRWTRGSLSVSFPRTATYEASRAVKTVRRS